MTTKRSYEDQLSMMSDHLCSMNETLTKQREEIDTLKMTSKVSCQVLTSGTGCSLEVCGLHLAFLKYYPFTNQFTSYSSYSQPVGKKTPNLVLHILVKKKFLQNVYVGKKKHFMSLLQSRLSKCTFWMIGTFFCLYVVKRELLANPSSDTACLISLLIGLSFLHSCLVCSILHSWQLFFFSVLFPYSSFSL